jgi:hypothetical protein
MRFRLVKAIYVTRQLPSSGIASQSETWWLSSQKIKTLRAQGHHQKEQYGRVISGHPVLQLQVDI